MKRPIIAGVMGLAFAGCAHTRTDVAQDSGGKKTHRPVALEPIPSIYETINRGTGNAALAQTALHDPKDPRWTGLAPPSGAGSPGRAATPSGASGESASRMAAIPAPARSASEPPAAGESMSGPVGSPPANLSELPAAQIEGARSAAPADVAAAAPGEEPGMTALPSSTGHPPAADVAPAAATASASTAMTPEPGLAAPGAEDPTAGGAGSPITGIPYSLSRPGGPMPEMLRRPPAGTTAAPSPEPAASPGVIGSTNPGASPSMNGLEPVGEPPAAPSMAATPPRATADAEVSPSSGPAAPGSMANPGPRPGKSMAKPGSGPGRDPLLGPNPDLMPELPPLPNEPGPAPAAAAGTSAPASPAANAKPSAEPADLPPPGAMPVEESGAKPSGGPADLPPLGPAEPPPPGGDLPPLPADPGVPAGSSADNRAPVDRSPTGLLADLPPLQPVVRLQSASSSDPAPRGSATPVSPSRGVAPARDPQLVQTSLHRAAEKPRAIPSTYRQAGMVAAKVGDETITIHDLVAVVRENCQRRHIPYDRLPRDQKEMFCRRLMDDLIEQSLLIQEAKHTIKEAKMYDKFVAESEHFWRDDQLPKLEIEFSADNEPQLREKLKEHGRSLETISRMTRREWMSEAFLRAKLKDRVKVELPDLLRYYNEHLKDREFDRPAQITWREIVVETSPQTTREQARRKIEAIQQMLLRGTDFATVARARSEGPSQSREQGGLMQTSPGSYGVLAVNAALDSLPLGKISEIIEGPSSFHIVKVEARRAAGPAPFAELQDQIRNVLFERKFQAERIAYLKKLRGETYVSSFFGTDDPQAHRVSQ